MAHDTLYLTQLRYDSIFVERDRSIDRTTDTIRIVDHQKEYRYRLVHDTAYIAHTDTLIQKDTLQVKDSIVVTTPPQVPRSKWFLLVLAYLFFRIRSPVKCIIRKFF